LPGWQKIKKQNGKMKIKIIFGVKPLLTTNKILFSSFVVIHYIQIILKMRSCYSSALANDNL